MTKHDTSQIRFLVEHLLDLLENGDIDLHEASRKAKLIKRIKLLSEKGKNVEAQELISQWSISK